MVKRTGPTNEHLKSLIQDLKVLGNEKKSNLWKRVASDLEKPTRIRRKVNIDKINLYSKDDEVVIVPGKVLAKGDLDKKVKVAAFQFSESAKEKINKKGKAISIKELMKENPKGSKIKLLG